MLLYIRKHGIAIANPHLLALGVDLKSAIQHGVSSNSYWQMSRTPVINQAISNVWLKEQGLLSVKDLWCKAQGCKRVANTP